MTRCSLHYVSALFSLLLPALTLAGDQLTAPRIYIKTSTHDLGTLDTSAPVDRTITITNVGNQPLHVAHTCTCGPRGSAWSRDIAPNESADLPVTLDPGDSRPGRITRTIKITSNDPAAPESRVTLTADYQPLIYLSAGTIDFGMINPAQPATANITILSRDNTAQLESASFEVPGVEPPRQITWRILPNTGIPQDPSYPGRLFLELTLPPGHQLHNLTGLATFTVRTQSPARATALTAQLTGTVITDLTASPRFLLFPDTTPGQPMQAATTISTQSGATFRITRATIIGSTLPAILDATIEMDGDPAKTHTLTLTAKAPDNAPLGMFRGELELTTDIPTEPPLRLPFHGIIRNSPANNR